MSYAHGVNKFGDDIVISNLDLSAAIGNGRRKSSIIANYCLDLIHASLRRGQEKVAVGLSFEQ